MRPEPEFPSRHPFDVFEPFLGQYEGTGVIPIRDEYTVTGYVECIQQLDGVVRVRMVTHGSMVPHEDEIALRGIDTNGWTIEFPRGVQPTFIRNRIGDPTLGEMFGYAPLLRVAGPSGAQPRSIDFLLANLVIGLPGKPIALEMTTEVNSFKVCLAPLTDYPRRVDELRARGAVMPTAVCNVSSLPEGVPPEKAMEIAQQLCWPLSLGTGNYVNWLALQGRLASGSPVLNVHRSSTSRGFSNAIYSRLGNWVDVEMLVRAWLESPERRIGDTPLSDLVAAFVDAASGQVFLENAGPAEATLLEVVTGAYCSEKGAAEIVPERAYRRDILPRVRKAVVHELQETGLVQSEQVSRMVNHLVGLFRTTLLDRLRFVAADLAIPVEDAELQKARDTRNSLAHGARYASSDRDDWNWEYTRLLWLNQVILLKLGGYSAEIPPFGSAAG